MPKQPESQTTIQAMRDHKIIMEAAQTMAELMTMQMINLALSPLLILKEEKKVLDVND